MPDWGDIDVFNEDEGISSAVFDNNARKREVDEDMYPL